MSSSAGPPAQTSTKRPHAPLGSHIDNVTDTTNAEDDAPRTKKSKKNPGQAVTLQNDVLIISIDDVDDLQCEWHNKIDATADIKEFFIPLPLAPGQDKGRAKCKLCW